MKKILSLFAAVLFAGSMMAEGLLFEQTYPGNPSAYVNKYTETFTITTDGHTLTYVNINNGQESSAWDALRAGHKTYDSKATITSDAIAEKVSKVVIDFTQVDANHTEKLALLVGDDASLANATEIVATIAVGEVAFVVENPAEGKFYQVVLDQKASGGNSNGFNRWDKIQFIVAEGGTPIVPETYDTLSVAQAIVLCEALADNASSETKYYVEGYAVGVEPYSAQYGNQIFFMADDAEAEESNFEAYAAYPSKDGKAYPVLEGDKVRAFGKLKKYVKDGVAQLEIVNPTVEFIEEVPGDRTIDPVEPEKLDTISAAEAKARCEALEVGATEKVAVLCLVASIKDAYNEQYGNVTVWLNDDPESTYGDIQAYRAKCSAEDGAALAEHDRVLVVGNLSHSTYEKDGETKHSYQIAQGAQLTRLGGQGIENIELTKEAQKVMFDGVMYIVRDGKMFNIQGAQVR
jgi:hypothetical protein